MYRKNWFPTLLKWQTIPWNCSRSLSASEFPFDLAKSVWFQEVFESLIAIATFAAIICDCFLKYHIHVHKDVSVVLYTAHIHLLVVLVIVSSGFSTSFLMKPSLGCVVFLGFPVLTNSVVPSAFKPHTLSLFLSLSASLFFSISHTLPPPQSGEQVQFDPNWRPL